MTNKDYIKWLKLLDEELTFDALVDGKDEMDMHEMIWELCEKLEQEPCEDCISRKAVLEFIKDCDAELMHDVENESVREDILNMPSVIPMLPKGATNGDMVIEQESKTGWIPVSERLPERYKEVIVTDVEASDTYQSRYIGNGYWECDNGSSKNGIIAWIPLPKPYKESE